MSERRRTHDSGKTYEVKKYVAIAPSYMNYLGNFGTTDNKYSWVFHSDNIDGPYVPINDTGYLENGTDSLLNMMNRNASMLTVDDHTIRLFTYDNNGDNGSMIVEMDLSKMEVKYTSFSESYDTYLIPIYHKSDDGYYLRTAAGDSSLIEKYDTESDEFIEYFNYYYTAETVKHIMDDGKGGLIYIVVENNGIYLNGIGYQSSTVESAISGTPNVYAVRYQDKVLIISQRINESSLDVYAHNVYVYKIGDTSFTYETKLTFNDTFETNINPIIMDNELMLMYSSYPYATSMNGYYINYDLIKYKRINLSEYSVTEGVMTVGTPTAGNDYVLWVLPVSASADNRLDYFGWMVNETLVTDPVKYVDGKLIMPHYDGLLVSYDKGTTFSKIEFTAPYNIPAARYIHILKMHD